ncbi:hypothetical protein ABFP60_20985 [Clostridioides difficile]
METISIALACTVIGAVISYATFQRNKGNDIRANTREEAETRAKLDYIATAVDEIRLDNKARDREVTELKERVIRNEESTKSAHKRIDEMERGVC